MGMLGGGVCSLGGFYRDILNKKLDYYGFKSTELNCFKSYFSERKQIARYNNEMSESKHHTYGVAQGTVLGPILFVVYVNDLVNCSDSLNFSMYADDTCVFLTDAKLNENLNKMNAEIWNISKWMKANSLTSNAEKSNLWYFIEQNAPCSVYVNGYPLKQCKTIKYLGVHLHIEMRFLQKYKFEEFSCWAVSSCV